jgi:phage-related baseplate assembly protein
LLSLSQLISPRSKEALRAQLLQALQGVGFVAQSGAGSGSMSAKGVAVVTANVTVRIVASGELGTATFQYSLDDGTTWSAIQTVPATGSFSIPSTGAALIFAAGPGGSGTSFAAGDTASFVLAIPTLPTTAWQPGTVPLSLLETDAAVLEDYDRLIATIAAGGLVDYAQGAWLDLLAWNVYGLTRRPAVSTKGLVLLLDTAGAGPIEIAVGQLWLASGNGKRFVNSMAATLPKSSMALLEITAESPGIAYNVANDSITTMITALPGVVVTNPDFGSGTWWTQAGNDQEGDESLRARCKTRWATLAVGATPDAYTFWARDASSVVTRTKVSPSGAPGEVLVLVAGASGGVSPEVVGLVQADLAGRIPLTSTVTVSSAQAVPVRLEGTVNVLAGRAASAQAAAETALAKYMASLPIGGVQLVGGGHGISLEALVAAISGQPGVVDLALSLPTYDVPLTGNQVATLSLGLLWQQV